MNDGGQAFPAGVYGSEMRRGMTLRDYFAAAALQGIVAHAYKRGPEFGFEPPHALASEAYRFADAMLAERGKE